MRELVKSVVGNVAFHTDLGGKEFTTFATGALVSGFTALRTARLSDVSLHTDLGG